MNFSEDEEKHIIICFEELELPKKVPRQFRRDFRIFGLKTKEFTRQDLAKKKKTRKPSYRAKIENFGEISLFYQYLFKASELSVRQKKKCGLSCNGIEWNLSTGATLISEHLVYFDSPMHPNK